MDPAKAGRSSVSLAMAPEVSPSWNRARMLSDPSKVSMATSASKALPSGIEVSEAYSAASPSHRSVICRTGGVLLTT